MYWLGAREGTNAFDLAVEILRAPLVAPSARSAAIGARDLGPAFDRWFLRAVHRDPAQRFPHAAAAFAELEPILEPPPQAIAPAPPTAPSRTWWPFAAVMLLVAIAVSVGLRMAM
jgi:hypothetical protein